MACLDTSVLLELMGRGGRRGVVHASNLITRLIDDGQALCTTCFNVAELLVGVHRSNDSPGERAKLKIVLDGLRVLAFHPECAEVFGAIQARLLAIGRPAGDMDVLIASVAIRHRERLVTGNAKHFMDIPELEIESIPR